MIRGKIKNAKRIVIKVGSSLVTNNGLGLHHERILHWVEQIVCLHDEGKQVVLVSSGAVAEGVSRLGLKTRPVEMHLQQAAAAVGQMGLVQIYESFFKKTISRYWLYISNYVRYRINFTTCCKI